MQGVTFQKICGSDKPSFDLVFVHGLTGHPTETWCCQDNKAEFWPAWLCQEFSGLGVHALGYPAHLFKKWIDKEHTIYEAANTAIELMQAEGLGARPLGFIAHSLGGLITKQILRASSDATETEKQLILKSTKLVAFLATPHFGTNLAVLLKAALPTTTSPSVTTLSNFTGNLADLNNAYRKHGPAAGIKTLVYFEKQPIKGGIILVQPEDADPGVVGATAIAIEADHYSICKPKNKNSTIYRSLRHRIEEALKTSNPDPIGAMPFDMESFADASTGDRRDLLTKMIAANRDHLYQQANEYQNKFAQRYHKNGLHTAERKRSDALLAEVQQRFILHVYNGKIMKGAQEEEIGRALQSDVIDPICAKFSTDRTVNPTAILQSLYFLTEQCHIRWDAE